MKQKSPFPKRLKQARTRVGLSQRELGVRAGIDEFSASARMNQYEKGVHAPDYHMAQRIAAQLQVPTCYLFCEEDDIANMITAYAQGTVEQRQQALDSLLGKKVAEQAPDYLDD